MPFRGPSAIPGAEKNLCRSPGCGWDFGGLYLFDRHRSHVASDGKVRKTGKCLKPHEMMALGWVMFDGVWHDETSLARMERAREMGRKK